VLLRALGRLRSNDDNLTQAIRTQLLRYTKLAELTPSYHSTIHIATLECRLESLLRSYKRVDGAAQSRIVSEMQHFRTVFECREYCDVVRVVAADCVYRASLWCCVADESLVVLNYLLDHVEGLVGSSSRWLRIKVIGGVVVLKF
jgi:hypothetical protein